MRINGVWTYLFNELFNKTKQLINLLKNPTLIKDDFEDDLNKMG